MNIFASFSILVIGEQPELYHSLYSIFGPCAGERDGGIVRMVLSAREALACLHDQPYDLAVLDLDLPGTHGPSLLGALRRLYPRLPVLVLAGDDSPEHTLPALRAGARGFLSKPVSPEQILFCAGEILRERQAARRLILKKSPGRRGKARVRPARLHHEVLYEADEAPELPEEGGYE